jgi:hypothetical protein
MPPKCFEVLAAAAFDTLVTNGTLASTTSGRTIVTDAAGLVDANAVKLGPTGAGTAQTRAFVRSVLLSTGTGTGQLDFTSGVVKANAGNVGGVSGVTFPATVADQAKLLKYFQLALVTNTGIDLTATEAEINSTSGTFAHGTDSQESLRDRGDAAWLTGSTHSAADVWAVATRTITGGTIDTITGLTIANAENMTTRFLGMIELDGSVYRYTTNALEMGPGGAGSDPLASLVPGSYASGTAGYYLGALGAGDITVSVPVVDDDGYFELVQGADYQGSNRVTFTIGASPNLSNGTVAFIYRPSAGASVVSIAGTVSGGGGSSQTVLVAFTHTQTAAMSPGANHLRPGVHRDEHRLRHAAGGERPIQRDSAAGVKD